MKLLKRTLALGAVALLSACANMPDTASRNAPLDPTGVQFATLPSSISVADINVDVPFTLNISEGNGYYPTSDIVWRGEPIGDRRAQIREIFETAFQAGTREMNGETALALDVQLKRFHSITDRTRLSVGGVHHMVFDLTVRDAATGAVLAPPREIDTSLKAYGGLRAIQADKRGQTQKVRVVGYLARVIQQELGQPVTR